MYTQDTEICQPLAYYHFVVALAGSWVGLGVDVGCPKIRCRSA